MTVRHSWTYEEDRICCEEFFRVCVIEKNPMSLSDFVRSLSAKLPALKPGSIRLKIQNTKQLALEHGIENSLKASPSSNYSKQNEAVFISLMRQYSLK